MLDVLPVWSILRKLGFFPLLMLLTFLSSLDRGIPGYCYSYEVLPCVARGTVQKIYADEHIFCLSSLASVCSAVTFPESA